MMGMAARVRVRVEHVDAFVKMRDTEYKCVCVRITNELAGIVRAPEPSAGRATAISTPGAARDKRANVREAPVALRRRQRALAADDLSHILI